jgi:nucleoid DNA-binding protein
MKKQQIIESVKEAAGIEMSARKKVVFKIAKAFKEAVR